VKGQTDELRGAVPEAIRNAGLEPPDAIEADGKMHRFSTNGHRGDDVRLLATGSRLVRSEIGGLVSKKWRAEIGRP
jgi:putative DNA primase/helicase